MKRKIVSIVISLTLVLSVCSIAFADGDITVKLNGEQLTFDVQPQLIGGRTMVPLRVIFESLGATVEWDEATSTVTAYDEFCIVKATIGSNTMIVNGKEAQIDVPPMVVGERTLVPARFVAEAFNCDVQWDATTKTVYITSGDKDYSQVEKDTSAKKEINEFSNQSNVNRSVYNKLKNIIKTRGEKYESEYGEQYSIYYRPKSKDYSILFSYMKSELENGVIHEDLSIYFSSDGNVEHSVLIMLYEEQCPSILYTVDEYRLFADFPNPNETFVSEKDEIPSNLREAAYELLDSVFGLMDIIVEEQTGLSLNDIGVYYKK